MDKKIKTRIVEIDSLKNKSLEDAILYLQSIREQYKGDVTLIEQWYGYEEYEQAISYDEEESDEEYNERMQDELNYQLDKSQSKRIEEEKIKLKTDIKGLQYKLETLNNSSYVV